MSMVKDLDALVLSSSEVNLGVDGNVWVDWSNRTFEFVNYDWLSNDGTSLQAFYSFVINKLWKNNDDITPEHRVRFPMSSTTPNKMEMLYGWDFKDANSRGYIRDGGLTMYGKVLLQKTDISFALTGSVISGSGMSVFKAGETIIINGSASNDGEYTVVSSTSTEIVVSEALVDEAVGSVIDLEGSVGDDSDAAQVTAKWMGIKTIAVDAAASLYCQVQEGGTIIDVTTVGGMNELVQIMGDENHGNYETDYFKVYNRSEGKSYVSALASEMGYSPLDADMYYYALPTVEDINILSSDGVVSGYGIEIWYYDTPFTRNVNNENHDFTILIKANGKNKREIYEFVQYVRRLNANINSNTTDTVIGAIAGELCNIEGNLLKTTTGVLIDNFYVEDQNSILFRDVNDVICGYPTSSDLYISSNVPDGCEFRMYIASSVAGEIGTEELLGYEVYDFATNGVIRYTYDYIEDIPVAIQIIATGYEEGLAFATLSDVPQNIDIQLEKESNL